MLYGHASYCIGDEEWRTCRLGFYLFLVFEMRNGCAILKAMKAESQQLCRCCGCGRCGIRCGWCDCGVGTGWPRECVRMLVDMVFECKG